MFENSTSDLNDVLGRTHPDQVDAFLDGYGSDLASEDKPFAAYMREMFKKKGIRQQDVFLKADIPERYGYRLIAQSKNTIQRDYILRFCLAAGFTLKETQRALKLYGMSELYARIPRDAVLIIAFHNGVFEIDEVNAMLTAQGMEPLKACAGQE